MSDVEAMKNDGGKCTVLGAGAWGTALANVLAKNGHEVSLWTRQESIRSAIEQTRENTRYLPSVRLHERVRAETDLAEALRDAELVVFVVPTQSTREVAQLAAPHLAPGTLIVSATKGIENGSLAFVDEILRDELPHSFHDSLAFLSGPSFAKELCQGTPTVVVIASLEASVCSAVMKRFHAPYLRLYASQDVVGVECGGALKNVIAIAAGACDGFGFGHNSRAALITRGLSEVARVAVARGGSPITVSGLSGMGDLVLTCTGELSRNRTVGLELGRGKKLADIVSNLGHVAEGVHTAKSAFDLGQRLGIELPIVEEVYRVLYEDKPADKAVRDLMSRDLGYEFDPATVEKTVALSPNRPPRIA